MATIKDVIQALTSAQSAIDQLRHDARDMVTRDALDEAGDMIDEIITHLDEVGT